MPFLKREHVLDIVRSLVQRLPFQLNKRFFAEIRIGNDENDVAYDEQYHADQKCSAKYFAFPLHIGLCIFKLELISDAVDRFDAPSEAFGVELGAETLDMRIDRSRFACKVISPHAG